MFRKKKRISELKEGEFIDDIFVVKVKRDFKPYIKGFSFRLFLSDASGQSLEYVYWGDRNESEVKTLFDKVSEDNVIHITGSVGRYRKALQISANSKNIFNVLTEDEYDSQDFILPPNRDVDVMFKELTDAVNLIKDKDIKSLLQNIFNDPEISKRIRKHPGGIEIHHNRYGGLLEHMLEILQYCLLSSKSFKLDKDYLIAGSLLHDIGKLEELSMKTRIKGTRSGQLLGHIVLGIRFLSKRMESLKTPKLIQEKLLHIISSHHGLLEYGSPKEPMFPEALAVHLADMMSSKLSEMQTFIEKVKGNTENDFAYYVRGRKNILLD